MILTPTERERLRTLMAEVMGWVSGETVVHPNKWAFHKDRYYDAAGLPAVYPKMLITDWHPDTSLDQAVMVADSMALRWEVACDGTGCEATVWGKGGQGNHVFARADKLAEAIWLACAKALRDMEMGE